MGHSWSVGRVRMSDPPRRAASLPSAIWRRIARSSHLQLGYRPDGLHRRSNSALLNPKLPVALRIME